MTTPPQPEPRDHPSRSGSAAVMQSLKVLVGGITGGIVFMGAALAFILRFTAPPLWTVALLLVLGLAAHTLIRTVGYRAKPIPPQTPTGEASTRSMGVFRSLMMMRMALAESVALIGIVLAFVTPQRSWLVFAVGAAVSLLLIALHVWPSRSSVDRVVASLEQDGARTGLHETLGLGGAVQDSRQPPGVQS